MRATNEPEATMGNRRSLLQGAGLATVGGLLWFATIMLLPNLQRAYEGEASALVALQDHRVEVFLGWVLLALGDVLIGVGIWMIARQVSAGESGWQAKVARVSGQVFLVAALASALIRVWPPKWWASVEDLAVVNDQFWWTLLVLAVWIGMSGSFILLAVAIQRSDAWPTGLGIALIFLGVLTLILFLPLFYWIGVIALGFVVLRQPAADEVAPRR